MSSLRLFSSFRKCFTLKQNFSVASTLLSATGTKHNFTHVKIELKGEKKNVGLITLNKPKVNSLSKKMVADLIAAFDELEANKNVGAVVVTGNDNVFCGGADISEMSKSTPTDWLSAHAPDFIGLWDRIILNRRVPSIAAVNGYALGGGMEISMAFDIIYAGDKAKFGQPEIKIGVIPGFGGTQRLIRQVGKSRAMEMILTGEMFTAQELERAGLISRVLPVNQVVPEAIKCAEKIAAQSKLAIKFAKLAVDKANELPLREGIEFERRLFYTLFASHDKQEGMKAFLEKRPPQWKDC